ncbi:MAG TPA: phosphoenolpyruvate--protein phosphotransferase [Deltaproteobacteria bacterium]|nr:phosphoenolpyruvate--protein phosphotransferase [Deltaproteobacteria bacterium]
MPPAELDHLSLLYDMGELAVGMRAHPDVPLLLNRVLDKVSEHLKAEVCSIYLLDEATRELVLKATKGLNPEAVEKVRMTCGTGLVGATMEALEPICEGDAPLNPRFKYFEEAREEAFRSFLAVPIQLGEKRIGVMVVQHSEPDYFDTGDVRALRAVATQLAGVLENARLLMSLNGHDGAFAGGEALAPGFVKGQAASPGMAYGPAVVFDRSHVRLLEKAGAFAGTEEDFHRAMALTNRQLEQLQETIAERLPESAALIFSAHLMILKDVQFSGRILDLIRGGKSAAQAVREVAQYFINLFSASPDTYLQEKVKDIEDLSGRILKNLAGQSWGEQGLYEKQIVIAPELYPSEILRFAAEGVAGIVLTSGGVSSHVSILARSLSVPLVIAVSSRLLAVGQDTPVLMDAEVGNVYINPDHEIVARFETRNLARRAAAAHAPTMLSKTFTKDGQRVYVRANINLLNELETAVKLKADGIGLYRTEFPFLIRTAFPSEDEEYKVYRRLCDGMPGEVVTFRTLDIGGDKLPSYWENAGEPNPQLGLRSIRFSLSHPDQFRQQLRAILRAGVHTPALRVMFPMIMSLDEFHQVRTIVDDILRSLAAEGTPHHARPALGVMIEVPAMVEIIDDLAAAADFLSIGTNDLVQYLLGVDRMNALVAYAYRPEHPAVLRTIKRLSDAACKAGKELSVCGEMANDRDLMPFLLGVGIRSLSVDPHHLPALQRQIGALTQESARAYAERLLDEPRLEGVRAVMESGVHPLKNVLPA